MAERHRWVKLRVHAYICRKCGTGKVNAERSPNVWQTTYHRPDGTSEVLAHVPPCAWGPLTVTYLHAHRDALVRVSALEEAAR